MRSAVAGLDGVAAAISAAGAGAAAAPRSSTSGQPRTRPAAPAAPPPPRSGLPRKAPGARVGGIPAQNADFIRAVYGNAWWIIALIVIVTFVLLARALRSIVLPVKALVLNVISIGAAYGITVLIWQHGVGTELLFGQTASGAITVWVPIAVFAFLFGLSMDYEVFLLSRIREEHDHGHDTDDATVHGVARTGRLVTSAALILFLAFIALSRVPHHRREDPRHRARARASSSTPPSSAASSPRPWSPPSAQPTGGHPAGRVTPRTRPHASSRANPRAGAGYPAHRPGKTQVSSAGPRPAKPRAPRR